MRTWRKEDERARSDDHTNITQSSAKINLEIKLMKLQGQKEHRLRFKYKRGRVQTR